MKPKYPKIDSEGRYEGRVDLEDITDDWPIGFVRLDTSPYTGIKLEKQYEVPETK